MQFDLHFLHPSTRRLFVNSKSEIVVHNQYIIMIVLISKQMYYITIKTTTLNQHSH